jgi:hypothetical protein
MIYEIADRHNALQYINDSVFYTEDGGTTLFVRLYFHHTIDASRFMTEITYRDWRMQHGRVRVECPEMYTMVSRDPADMKRLYRSHYKTRDNLDSPAYALPAHWLERVALDDEQQLQMFERRESIEMCAYRCHILSNLRPSIHAANENEVAYMSWLPYLYLHGIHSEDIPPCMLLSPVKLYRPTTIQLERRNVRRQRMDVIMDFLEEEQLEQLHILLHEGSTKLNPTRLRTHIYVHDAETTAALFQQKCEDTKNRWRERCSLYQSRALYHVRVDTK